MANKIELPDIELVAAQVHEQWMETKRSQGVTSRKSETGEELMVPYPQLSEPAKDLDRNTVKTIYRAIQTLLVWLCLLMPAQAQTDPCQGLTTGPCALSRANLSGLTYAGTLTYDWPDGGGGDLSSNPGALGVSADGNSLYMACNSTGGGVAKLTIPGTSAGGTLTPTTPCGGIMAADVEKVMTGYGTQGWTWDAGARLIGGVGEIDGKVCVAAYGSYDASGNAIRSHWCANSIGTLSGMPYGSTVSPGLVFGQIGSLPTEWRTLLGAPGWASGRYSSIISRQSAGPLFSVFDPDDVVADNFPMTVLLGCPHVEAPCNTRWTGWGKSSIASFQGAELSGGIFPIPGTRTLVVVEREGYGSVPGAGVTPAAGATSSDPHDCYGYATTDPALHGTDNTGPDDARNCYSLADNVFDKGNKAYPYALIAKLYDLKDLWDVKQGTKNYKDVVPYSQFEMPTSSSGQIVTGGAYNAARDEFYLMEVSGGGVNTLKVFTDWNTGQAEICGNGIDDDGNSQIDEGCTPPDLSVSGVTTTCRVVVNAQPPDPTGGWRVQFTYDGKKFGASDATAPYSRTRTFYAGTYTLSGVWTKTGRTNQTIPNTTFVVPTDCP